MCQEDGIRCDQYGVVVAEILLQEFLSNEPTKRRGITMLPSVIVLDGVGLELSALLRIPSTHDLHDVFVDFFFRIIWFFTKILFPKSPAPA